MKTTMSRLDKRFDNVKKEQIESDLLKMIWIIQAGDEFLANEFMPHFIKKYEISHLIGSSKNMYKLMSKLTSEVLLHKYNVKPIRMIRMKRELNPSISVHYGRFLSSFNQDSAKIKKDMKSGKVDLKEHLAFYNKIISFIEEELLEYKNLEEMLFENVFCSTLEMYGVIIQLIEYKEVIDSFLTQKDINQILALQLIEAYSINYRLLDIIHSVYSNEWINDQLRFYDQLISNFYD